MNDWAFHGNSTTVATLRRMITGERIPQTILLHGPEGLGKATLARRLAAALLEDSARIELDDLSRAENVQLIADREKWTAEKRNEDPLLFASHPDFVTFPPDGPLRQLSIPQMRVLKERAQFKPLKGPRRVFLIDHLDRANEQAANSLLKTLEEPPEHMVFILTAENAYDLLPTIRSRSVSLPLAPLAPSEMQAFLASREDVDQASRRLALAGGRPGVALRFDLEAYDKRRTAMLALLRVAARQQPYGSWVRYAESISASKSEKLESYLEVLYFLLSDVLVLSVGGSRPLQNPDIAADLQKLAAVVPFQWIEQGVKKVDALAELVRRNIQKSIALDAFALDLRRLRT